MEDRTIFKFLLLGLGFALVLLLVIMILSIPLGLLFLALMVLIITILWYTWPTLRRVLDHTVFAFFRARQDKKRQEKESEQYDNQFHVEYQLVREYQGRMTTYPIVKEEFVIGRTKGCDMVIANDQTISRQHCRIVYRRYSHTYFLEDLHSDNGTYLGTKRLEPYTQEKLLENAMISISNRKYRFVKIEK